VLHVGAGIDVGSPATCRIGNQQAHGTALRLRERGVAQTVDEHRLSNGVQGDACREAAIRRFHRDVRRGVEHSSRVEHVGQSHGAARAPRDERADVGDLSRQCREAVEVERTFAAHGSDDV